MAERIGVPTGKLLDWYAQGDSLQDIADRLGVTREGVRRKLMRNGGYEARSCKDARQNYVNKHGIQAKQQVILYLTKKERRQARRRGNQSSFIRGVLAPYLEAGCPEVEIDDSASKHRTAVYLPPDMVKGFPEGKNRSLLCRQAIAWARL